jgi:hypothetical protein
VLARWRALRRVRAEVGVRLDKVHRTFSQVRAFLLLLLALTDGHTAARWSELVGQQPQESDQINKAIWIKQPLTELQEEARQG